MSAFYCQHVYHSLNESIYTKEQIEKLRLENAVGKSNASFSVSQFRLKK